MIRRPPSSTLAYTRFPDTTRIRAVRYPASPARLRLTWCLRTFQNSPGKSLRAPAVCFSGRMTGQGYRIGGRFCHEEVRSEEHTSELQSLMRISYAVFCLKKKKAQKHCTNINTISYTYTQYTP